jgi:hypothetical protein
MWLRYKQHIKNHVPTYSIVIFVLSAQNDCFLLAHENEFLVKTVKLQDFKLIRMRQRDNHLAHEIQTLFFLQQQN